MPSAKPCEDKDYKHQQNKSKFIQVKNSKNTTLNVINLYKPLNVCSNCYQIYSFLQHPKILGMIRINAKKFFQK